MKCWKCLSVCDEKQKFCPACGTQLQITCQECGTVSPLNDGFCIECGFDLTQEGKSPAKAEKATGQRKHVTALFADLSGYTALSERLDPEEAKDIMNRFFAEIAKILKRYEGFIEKFTGDAVLALFGVPTCHEDDPARSIRAAIEIHHAMVMLSNEFQDKAGGPLSVHIGINTGLVVTGGIRPDDGLHRISGDALNVASRLCSLAKGGETLVGHLTYSLTEGFFFFERLDPAIVKGRVKPVLVYRLLRAKETPSKTHRVSGLRAGLIGRRTEIARLEEGMQDLLAGKGSVIALCGEAGTGKSRLIEEFKSALNQDCVQCYEGSAYAYSQNTAYFPIADLLGHIFRVEGIDSPEKAAEKVENGTRAVVDDAAEVLPYLWEILSIRHLGSEDINPDAWKARLHKAILAFFSGLIRRVPTVIILEDLHWADPSSLEVLPFLVARLNSPVLFLCTYRPPLTLFHSQQLQGEGTLFSEMPITELSPLDVQLMIRSLLGTEVFPASLQQFVDEKVGGNPFYLEEVINSLVESELLVYRGRQWHFEGSVDGRALPATIQGVINSRLDRLDPGAKELLQEASVMGRVFYAEILKKITASGQSPDRFLDKLRQLDLIRVWSAFPDLEFYFRHSLIQEVVYNGLLRNQRRDIHDRVGLALERFFSDKSLEDWETLAYHFKNGHDVCRAVDYLMKSGEKSLKRYALEEANQYFKEAYEILSGNQARSKEEDLQLVELLMRWCLVFYYQGRFEGMSEMLLAHLDLAESSGDKAKIGAYHAWLGHAVFWQGEGLDASYCYLHRALALGEETGDRQVIGAACSFLIKTCAERGYLDEAAVFEERTRGFLELFASDTFFYITYYSGKAFINWFRGDRDELYLSAGELLDYGEKISSLRCIMIGNLMMAFSLFMGQEMEQAIEHTNTVIDQADPYHVMIARTLKGMFLVHTRKFREAELCLNKVIVYSEGEGTEYLRATACIFLGAALAAQGNLSRGVRLVETASEELLKTQRIVFHSLAQFVLGSIYLQILRKSSGKNLSIFLKNVPFLMKNVFSIRRKAEKHLSMAIELSEKAGARGFLGQPYLQMGLLFLATGKPEKARQYLLKATDAFEQCGPQKSLEQARDLLSSIM